MFPSMHHKWLLVFSIFICNDQSSGGKDYTRGCPTLEEAAVRAVLLGFESSLGFWATRYECRVSWVEGWWFSIRTGRFTVLMV